MDIIVSGAGVFEDIEHHHHHHHHECCEGEDCDCHHEHHHECCEGEDCDCHHDHDHHDHHHHHHHNDDTFKNQILRPNKIFSKKELEEILERIPEDIIRVKGYVFGDNTMWYINYVLNESSIFEGDLKDEALVSVIGTQIDHNYFEELFNE